MASVILAYALNDAQRLIECWLPDAEHLHRSMLHRPEQHRAARRAQLHYPFPPVDFDDGFIAAAVAYVSLWAHNWDLHSTSKRHETCSTELAKSVCGSAAFDNARHNPTWAALWRSRRGPMSRIAWIRAAPGCRQSAHPTLGRAEVERRYGRCLASSGGLNKSRIVDIERRALSSNWRSILAMAFTPVHNPFWPAPPQALAQSSASDRGVP